MEQKLSGSHKALVEMQDVVAELLRSVPREHPATKVRGLWARVAPTAGNPGSGLLPFFLPSLLFPGHFPQIYKIFERLVRWLRMERVSTSQPYNLSSVPETHMVDRKK